MFYYYGRLMQRYTYQQFSIWVKWVGDGLVHHEDFTGLYQVNNIEAGPLADTIKDILLRMALSLS